MCCCTGARRCLPAGDAAAHAHLRCLRRNSLKSWLQCVKIIEHTHCIRFAHTRVVCVNENCVLVFVSLKTHATTPQDALSFRMHLQGLRRVETRHAGLFPRTRHGLRERRMISGYPHMIDMCRRIPDIWKISVFCTLKRQTIPVFVRAPPRTEPS